MKKIATTAIVTVFTALAVPANAAGIMGDDGIISTTADNTKNAAGALLSTPGRVMNVGTDDLPGFQKGTQEFGLSGNLNWTGDVTYALQLHYGWFVTDNIQIGIDGGFTGQESDINVNFGLFTEYNFNTGTKWVPFIGGSLGWARVDSDAFSSNSITVGMEVGVKYFLRENLALSFSVGGDFLLDSGPDTDDFNRQIQIGTVFQF